MTHPIRDNFPHVFPHCAALGLELKNWENGNVTTQLPPRPEFKAHPSMDIMHSSALASVADTTAGLAAMSALPEMAPLATLDLRVDYLKPASSNHTVVADTECFKLTQNVAFVRGTLWQQDPSNIVANVTGSFMLDTMKKRTAENTTETGHQAEPQS